MNGFCGSLFNRSCVCHIDSHYQNEDKQNRQIPSLENRLRPPANVWMFFDRACGVWDKSACRLPVPHSLSHWNIRLTVQTKFVMAVPDHTEYFSQFHQTSSGNNPNLIHKNQSWRRYSLGILSGISVIHRIILSVSHTKLLCLWWIKSCTRESPRRVMNSQQLSFLAWKASTSFLLSVLGGLLSKGMNGSENTGVNLDNIHARTNLENRHCPFLNL